MDAGQQLDLGGEPQPRPGYDAMTGPLGSVHRTVRYRVPVQFDAAVRAVRIIEAADPPQSELLQFAKGRADAVAINAIKTFDPPKDHRYPHMG